MKLGWGRLLGTAAIIAVLPVQNLAHGEDANSQIVFETVTNSGSSTQLKDSGATTAEGKGDLNSGITYITPAAFSADSPQVEIVGNKTASAGKWSDVCGNATSLSPEDAKRLVDKVADETGEDVRLAESLVQAESRFNNDQISEKGAIGLTQLMPDTAARLGVNPCKPEENVKGGLAYLGQLRKKFGNTVFALAAYNAGPDRIDQFHGVPPYKETLDYVAAILTDYYSRPPQGAAAPADTDATPVKVAKANFAKKTEHANQAGSDWKSGFVLNLD